MIYVFVGTTAELIKLFPVVEQLRSRGLPFKIIASGQNDIRNSELWKLIGVSHVDFVLSTKPIKQTPLGLLSWFFRTLLGALLSRPLAKEFKDRASPSFMVIHGDTISTLMGALVARRYGLRVAHVEAGLRSFNFLKPFPEEICRVIVSKLAHVSFCPNEWAAGNLKKTRSQIVITHQNTLLDSMLLALRSSNEEGILSRIPSSYFIAVIHRQENILDLAFLRKILDRIIAQSARMHCVFILHEPTKRVLEENRMLDRLTQCSTMTLAPRLPYLEFTQLLNRCEFIVTDGGSNQEESFYFGKPCLVLRGETERVEGLGSNVVLSRKDFQAIDEFFSRPEIYRKDPVRPQIFPSEIIGRTFSSLHVPA